MAVVEIINTPYPPKITAGEGQPAELEPGECKCKGLLIG
jgi:hypothetical protein